MHGNAIDITGHRFGRLVAIRHTLTDSKALTWLCRCDCGKEAKIPTAQLRCGQTRSCGCLKRDCARACMARIDHRRHGDGGKIVGKTRTREYTTWGAMIQRCHNSNNRHYKNYGGRGISVCEKWRKSYPAFLADVGRKPHPALTIDRYPNNDGNYEPGNVRWATRKEQTENRRCSKRVARLN